MGVNVRRLFVVVTTVCLLVGVAAPVRADEGSKFREPVRSSEGVVATEAPAASEIGIDVLDDGGNAIDAAVTMMIAMTAARPQSCGIGGGGFLVYRSADGSSDTIDFRETAPAAMEPDTFQAPGPHQSFTGHLTVGVPGVLRGAREALRRFGTITLSQAVRPAERLAAEGIEVLPSLSTAMTQNAERLKLYPESASIYLKDSTTPYAPGDILVNPDLAETLELIRERGIRAFYEGVIAKRIVRDMRKAGDVPGDRGIMRLGDLEAYEAKLRDPVTGSYNGHDIIGMPPPTSGGIATIQMLNLLEGFDIAGAGQSSANHLHLVAESQKLAFADRAAYVADPDFEDVPTQELISKDYADERRVEIDPTQAKSYPPGDFASTTADNADNPDGHTTHISVVDADGNSVALTCTIEQEFGSAVVAPKTGFLLNNEMTDFGAPGTANEPEPFKRPRSSMSPTIVVRDGEPVLVVGGAGGVRIIMGVLNAIVGMVDFGLDLAHALDAERVEAAGGVTGPPFPLELEDGRVDEEVEVELGLRGHTITPNDESEYLIRPRVNAAGIDPATGQTVGLSDPRTDDAARGQM
ncbi:MAG: gamma-glutamyltransferase [Actinomycetota bacterium]|nr:gamma-glutamyltransferase [Actinomycetota bacterium]